MKVVFLAFNTDFVVANVYMCSNHSRMKKLGQSITKKRNATFWNGALEYIDSIFLVSFITSAIRLE